MDFCKEIKGKKVTLMGLGLLGRGVGDAKFLAECGAELIVTDLKSEEELQVSVNQLCGFSNVSFRLGRHDVRDFEERDLVIKGAGVPLQNKHIAHAVTNGVPIAMSAALFHKYSGIPMIGVTGTRGKTTVTKLIEHILRSTGREVLLGGNIRGVSNLQLLKEVEGKEVAVFELDSWQLQGFGYEKRSPEFAVFTNLMPDHMTYYHNDMDLYFKDKANIYKYQNEKNVLVVGESVAQTVNEERAIVANAHEAQDELQQFLTGEHNRENIALAIALCRAYGISQEDIVKGVKSFRGVEGRLEYMGEVDGVRVFNDSTSTTPQATIAGIHAVQSTGKLIVIVGGSDKELSLTALAHELESVDEVILLSGDGTDKLIVEGVNGKVFDTLEEAVDRAFEMAQGGDTILFSPGFASFGMFVNEYERNDIFVDIIKKRRH